ncbi:unnamed protein product [Cuscuta epithymum]|uniref:Uncharacterized protein n=1 Tax=Cuscuta epithymum TaxID=186058 RepID=A0AAV0CNB4_9ASTE|nr:unnamed protein product [Cuscuta epithymum]
MDASSFGSGTKSTPSSENELSLTKKLLNGPLEDDALNVEYSSNVPLIVSSMLTAAKFSLSSLGSGRCYIRRDRRERHDMIVNDYFKGENSKYTPELFRKAGFMAI